jgi:hypothetical protein
VDARSLGLLIAVAGAGLVVIGLLVAAGAFGWFGRLPGDLRFVRGNVRVSIPVVSMLLISLRLTVAANVASRLR